MKSSFFINVVVYVFTHLFHVFCNKVGAWRNVFTESNFGSPWPPIPSVCRQSIQRNAVKTLND